MRRVAFLGISLALAGCAGGSGPAMQPGLRSLAPPPPQAMRREATRIASAGPIVRRLLGIRRLDVIGTGTWDSVDGGHLGASLELAVRPPADVDADLPYVVIPPDGPTGHPCVHPYAEGWAHARALRVTRLLVLVDVRHRAVVDIGPLQGAWSSEPIPGRPHPDCQEAA